VADGCLLLLEDGSGFLLLESASLRLEDGSGDLALEDEGTLSLEDDTSGRLLLEACLPDGATGGWAEQWTVREQETDLVIAVVHSLRRRRRLTVG
jgi:hypothetical protein